MSPTNKYLQLFAIQNELIDNTTERIDIVIASSVGTAFSVYQIVGIIGYLTFGNIVSSNIIQMYPAGIIITGCQISIAILFLLSYPLQCHPARASLDKVFSAVFSTDSRFSHSSSAVMTERKFLLITTALLVSSYFISISVDNLSTVRSNFLLIFSSNK